MNTPPPLPSRERTNPDWWSRNWKWFVTLLCVVMAALLVGFVASVSTLMKLSDPYVMGLEKAQNSPTVRAILGDPIDAGWFVTGNVSVSGPSGKAELSIPISGPDGNGQLFLKARKTAGQWSFDYLFFRAEDKRRQIDLLSP